MYWLGLAVEEDPDNAKTRERMADILLAVGRHDEAIEHYRYLTGIADRQKSATVKLADALMEAGRADEAAGLYSSMLRGDLNNATLFLRLGDALAKSDRGDKAMLCFRTSNAVHLRKPLPDRSVLEILDRLAPA